MLKFFRKHARGWFMLVFMAIIIFVFVLYFGTDRGSNTTNAVAVVDGIVISESEYYHEYSKLMDAVKARYGGAMTADLLKQMNLKKFAYDNLINRQVIIAKAKDLKLQISDDELRQAITDMPALQTDGKYDPYKYNQLLRYNRVSAEDFEASQRVTLAASKIESIIREGVKVSDQEAFDLFALQNQKIDLSFVQISGADVTGRVHPTDADLESYLKNNGQLFRIPEQVKIKYLYFEGKAFSPAQVDESDIRDYYNRRKDQFKTKDGKPLGIDGAKGQISQEIKRSRGMQTAYNEAKKAHDTIYQDENFDAYAAKNNFKIYTSDFFPLNKPPREFSTVNDLAQQLAGLEKKDISKVLTTEDGYFVIYIEDTKPAYTPRLKDIEKDVRQAYLKAESNKIAAAEARDMLEKMQKGESLEKLAAEKGLKVQDTGAFQPGTSIPKIGVHPEALEMILALSPNHPYPEKPIELNSGYVVLKLKELSAPDLKDFLAQKDMYRKAAMNMKREEVMKSWLEGNKVAMIKEKRLKINKQAEDL